MRKAGLYSAWSVSELNDLIISLSQEGYRIVSTFQTDNGMIHVVAQEYEVL